MSDDLSAAAPGRVPSSLVTAAIFLWFLGLVHLVAYVVVFVKIAGDKDELRRLFEDADTTITDTRLDEAFFTTLLGLSLAAITTVLLWAWMAWKNGQGRHWARVVATVLGVINMSFLIWGMAYSQPFVGALVSWITVILGALTIALLWNQESNAYFRARRAAQRA